MLSKLERSPGQVRLNRALVPRTDEGLLDDRVRPLLEIGITHRLPDRVEPNVVSLATNP